MSSRFAITLRDLTFEWPDGSVVLSGVNGAFNPGRTGLVGRNGAGKSTLLRLIAGILQPTAGQIEAAGEVSYLPQTLTLQHDTTIAQLLGIDAVLAAMRAIEAGDSDTRHFDAIGDDWDIVSRADELLHQIGFSAEDLDRRVREVSGGEAMLLAVTGLRIRRAPVTLLDEPTNNLDRPTRAKLAGFVDQWPGTLVVVSHDLELLEHMDSITELYGNTLSTFGGPYSAWQAHQALEQAAALQSARTAQQALKVEQRQRVEAETKLARRERAGKKAQREGGVPKIVAGNLARKAQTSAGALRGTLDDKVQAAQTALEEADARVRDDAHIRLILPDPDVPRGKRIAAFTDGDREILLQGPQRVALVGANGTGKTTLLDQLTSGAAPVPGRPHGRLFTTRVGYLRQRLDALDDDASAVANVQAVAPTMAAAEIRNQLARLLLVGDSVDRPVRTLSGGERFSVALARLLLAEPPPQLLIFDEPTNNLDIGRVAQLAEALDAYRGALLVVSHDYPFLERITVSTVIEIGRDGRLQERGGL
ncbi:MAG: ATP-binding cassette domain-containing protein [Thermomicrobiales bacterium]